MPPRSHSSVLALAATAVAVGAAAWAVYSFGRAAEAGPPARDDSAPPTAPVTAAPTTTTTAPPTTAAPTTIAPPPPTQPPPPAATADGRLEPGEEGEAVLALQQRLSDLGYWLGEPDGRYGHLTTQAVMAFQKAEGLGRDGVAGPATMERLAVATRPVPRGAGDGLEIDLARQLLLVVDDGAVLWAINTSTGRSGWETPPGEYAIDREIDGMRHAPLGDLYRPKYFRGGIAVHGSADIPGRPASHGCTRVSNAAMDLLWSSGVAPLGTPVSVY